MEPEPHDDPGATGVGPDPDERAKPDPDETPADEAAEPDVEDDGSVPEKQIQRWKDEGGAVLPPA